ncbi:MAG: ABC transporter permease [Candidatus Acidiferrum sp.]
MGWFRRLFHNSRAESELDRELRFHLEQQIADNLAAGMAPEEARRDALIQFGGIERVKQEVRDAHWETHVENLLRDLRYAIRSLCHDPRFALTAILALALGIGANTALFSIVNAVLLRPLPYRHAEQLVTLRESKPNFATGSVSFPNFLDWRKDNRTFASMAVMRGGRTLTLTGISDAEQVNAMLLSSGFFEQLAVNPVLGRTFTEDEERVGAAPTVMLAAAFWKGKFAASPEVLGKSLTLDGKDFTIIGVVPASFDFLGVFRSIDVYQPIGQWNNTALLSRTAGLGISGLGRLKAGVTIDQARADMQRVSQNLAAAYPDADKNIGAALIPFRQWNLGSVQSYLFVLFGAVGFVLLIACVNVANLLLARSITRAHEFAIRSALGAGQSRIIRQLLVESVLVAALGGAAGLLLAALGTQAILRTLPTSLPRADGISIDVRVFLFALVLSFACGIFFGLVPALKTARRNLQQALQEGGRGSNGQRHRLQGVLVAAEISLALVLLIGAGLMIRTLTALRNVNPGFDADKILTFGLSLPPTMMNANPDAVRAALRGVQQKFESAPGVQYVAYSWGALPLGYDDEWLFWIDGGPKPASKTEMNWALDYVVGPDYFKAMGIHLQSGRFFTEQDNEHAPHVAVIDEVLAKKFFPGINPIGQRLYLNNDDQTTEIIGVANHINQWGLDSDTTQELRAQLYVPFMQLDNDNMARAGSGLGVIVRSDKPAQVFASMRQINRQISNQQVVFSPQTMNEIIATSLADRRFSMILLGLFAALALLLSSVGIYGVVSYIVSQRTREIGIRVALGARHADILGFVLRQAAKMALIGVLLGLAVSFALTRLLSALLFRVTPTDPLTLATVVSLLLSVTLAACLLPARRAARVDPLVALRYE